MDDIFEDLVNITPEMEYQLIRQITANSFPRFVQEFWSTIISTPLVWNWHMEIICNEVQKVLERLIKGQPKLYDLVINISPGASKSSICSIFASVWLWTRMPQAVIINASYPGGPAGDFGIKARTVLKSPLFRKCFPEIQLAMDTTHSLRNTVNGVRLATSIAGAVTGKHAHLLLIDDPLDVKGSASPVMLDKANTWMRESVQTRVVDSRIVPLILIQQRLAENDPTGEWLAREGNSGKVRHICLPAEIEDDTTVVKPPELKKYYKDGLFDPVRMPREILDERRARMGSFAYACQYLQIPIAREGNFFMADRLHFAPYDPSDTILKTVRYWDKAISTSMNAAYTVGAKMAIGKSGKVWILDIIRGRWDSDRREKIIKQTAIADGRGVQIGVESEPGSGGQESAIMTVRNLQGFNVFVDRVMTNKAARADAFSSQVNGGNVWCVDGQWNRDFKNELQYFPVGRYKDMVDASAGAYNLLINHRQVSAFGKFSSVIPQNQIIEAVSLPDTIYASQILALRDDDGLLVD